MRCSARTLLRAFPMAIGTVLLLVSAARADADRAWHYIESLRETGRDEIALTELESFQQDHPKDPRALEAWRQIASIHRAAGRETDALDALARAIESHPHDPTAAALRLELGDLLVESGRLDDAGRAYHDLLVRHPLSDEVSAAELGYARVLARRGRTGEARSRFAHLIGSRVSADVGSQASFELAVLEAQRGDTRSALARFDAIHRRYPGTPAADDGLLRAAAILESWGARREAERRYRQVLVLSGDRIARGSAHLGLAQLIEDDDPARAYESFAEAAEAADATTNATQRERALRGMVRTALARGDRKAVRDAAARYRAHFPTHEGLDDVRLHVAIAERDTDELAALGRSADVDIAFRALAEGARSLARQDPEAALTRWRAAEARAPDRRRRVEALLAQAELALDLERTHLAADLAFTAHDVAARDDDRAQALLLATRAYVVGGERLPALRTSARLVDEHPFTPQAIEARQQVRVIERQRLLDPREAARELAALAEHEIVDFGARSFEVATIHRDRLGDLDAALKLFEKAIAQASHPEQRARYEVELGRTLRLRAFLEGSRGDVDDAASTLRDAKETLADAAVRAGRESSAQHARVLLIAMELADRVRPDAPWEFDGWTTPVTGAVGVGSELDPRSAALDTVRTLLRAARTQADSRDERAWLRWRQAEIGRASHDQRVELARSALDANPSPALEAAIRTTLGHLLLRRGDVDASSREFTRAIDADPDGDLAINARFGLGEARRRQGRLREARRCFDAVATIHPDRLRGQYALLVAGDCAAYDGDLAAASTRYRRLLERHPSSVYADDALYRWGLLLERDGELDAARDPWERLAHDFTYSRFEGRALAGLGRIAAAHGRLDEAIDAYARWIESNGREAARSDAWLQIVK